MQRKIELQPAYLLHARPFRDTSLIIDFYTPVYGRVSCLARGARRPSSKHRALLQPFIPLLLSCSGRGELMTLTQVEQASVALMLRGELMFSGLYLNELLVRLLQKQDADPSLFSLYQDTLRALAGQQGVEAVLRSFELGLLDSLGYGLALDVDCQSGEPVDSGGWYSLDHSQGVTILPARADSVLQQRAYPGAALLSIAQGDFSAEDVRRYAKRLTRELLQPHLGDRPLRSRQLFARR